MYGYAVAWAMAIVGIVELIKRMWLIHTGCKTERYKRVVALLPVLVGILTAPIFGPVTLAEFGLELSVEEALWFGPAAGAVAGWAFALSKHTIGPMLPSALRATFVAAATRAGLNVPDDVDAPAAQGDDPEHPKS